MPRRCRGACPTRTSTAPFTIRAITVVDGEDPSRCPAPTTRAGRTRRSKRMSTVARTAWGRGHAAAVTVASSSAASTQHHAASLRHGLHDPLVATHDRPTHLPHIGLDMTARHDVGGSVMSGIEIIEAIALPRSATRELDNLLAMMEPEVVSRRMNGCPPINSTHGHERLRPERNDVAGTINFHSDEPREISPPTTKS